MNDGTRTSIDRGALQLVNPIYGCAVDWGNYVLIDTDTLSRQTNNTHHDNELIQQISLPTSVLEGVLCHCGIR